MKSLKDLTALRDAAKANMGGYRMQIQVCGGTNCASGGGTKIAELFEEKIKDKGLSGEIRVVHNAC